MACGEQRPAYLDRDHRGRDAHRGTVIDQEREEGTRSGDESDEEGQPVVFRCKAHIGVDSKQGIVHSVCASAASVSDVHMLPDLLHGEEKKLWGDPGYPGQGKVIREAAPHAQGMTSRRAKHKGGVDEAEQRKNRTKVRVRFKVEWPFRILKRVFGFTKVRYRGLKKNHEWLLTAFALVNLYQHRKRLALLGA
jgi:IS5 family transposase